MSPRSIEYHLEEIFKRFIYDTKGFAKHEKVAKIIKALVKLARKFYISVNEDDIEKLLEAVLEVLTTEGLFELKQECIPEEEAKEKEK